MFRLLIVLIVIYLITILLLGMKGSKNSIKRITYNQKINEKDIVVTQFSSKPESGCIALMFIAIIFAGCLVVMYTEGKEKWNMSDIAYTVAIAISWVGFIYLAIVSLVYGWVRLATCGENLVISDEKIIAIYITIAGLNVELNDMDIEMKEVTEVIIEKREKKLGLELTSLYIRTADHKYEFIMPVDAEGTKAVIEKRMSV